MGWVLVASMRRYWIEKNHIQGERVDFTNEIFHHIFSVCRQENGSRFEVLTGDGRAHLVEVELLQKKSAQGKILSTREIPSLPKPLIKLFVCIPRFQVMDSIVERAVEMGVSEIIPCYSDCSFMKSSLPEGKIDRWRKIVISATQQSGRGELMPLSEPVDLTQVLKKINPVGNPEANRNAKILGLFSYEGQAKTDIRTYLRGIAPDSRPDEIWLFVGAEGGFSKTEVEQFQEVGLESVSLGEQVLRVETACIALLAVLKYEFELMR
jgi:16S rRNA (uracil1498-N3)-methyltransferase